MKKEDIEESPAFLRGGGECGALVERFDWGATSLGPIESWPASLTATVANLLHTRQPMLLFWGPDLIQVYNDSFVPSFGRGKHPEAMGQPARECWSEAWPVIGDQIEAVMRRGEPAWHEDALVPIHRNGRMEEVFWTYSYSPAFDAHGRVQGTLVIVTEMTERVVTARRLEALSSLSTALSSTSSRDATLDALSDVVESHAADLPFVIVCESRDGEPVVESALGLDADRAAAIVAGSFGAGATHTGGELALSSPVPGRVWPEDTSRAFLVGLGTHTAVRWLLFGLSPRLPFDDAYRRYLLQIADQLAAAFSQVAQREGLRAAEAERLRVMAALQDANRAKDEFFAMLSHELRNPLAPIVTSLELMELETEGSSEIRSAITRHVRHMTRLVDDLLDVARISRGKITLNRGPVEVRAVVDAAVELSRPFIETRDHELTLDVTTGMVIHADESRLVQVVCNLLTNAARYTPEGGRIDVLAGPDGDQVVLRVRDTGVGIEPDQLERVFDLFSQGSRGADSAQGGLGIGLALVKNLVELHGGSVSAASHGPGQGSEVTVRLPLAESLPASNGAAPRPVRDSVAPAGMRVLIVDDNEDAAWLLGAVVRRNGYELEIAARPSEAISLLDRFEPDAAVLDIGLPEMDGYELATLVRSRLPACRLIALTGYGQPSDHRRSSEAGFCSHLVKPVQAEQLLRVLAQLLDGDSE